MSEATTTGSPMSDAEYRTAMDLLAASVRTIRLLPIDQLRNHVLHAETLGPILEPTAYQRGGADNLRDQAEILNAAAALVAAAKRVEARAGARRG